MENLMACRICLVTDVKLYEMCKYSLKTAYENITGLKACVPVYPQQVCIYCATLLHKYTEFRARCHTAQNLITELVQQSDVITTSDIKCINLEPYNISVPYTTNIIQNYDTTVSIKDENEFINDNYELNIGFESHTDNYVLNTHEYNLNTESYNSDDDEKSLISIDVTKPVMNKKLTDKKRDCPTNIDINKDNFDSDEEPLAKKVPKKEKKRKKCVKSLKSKERCSKTVVKTEKIDELPAYSQPFTLNDKNYSTNDKNYSTNDKNDATDDKNDATDDSNQVTNDNNDTENDEQQKQTQDSVTNHELTILTIEEQIKEVLDRKTSANYLNSFYKCDSCYKGFMTENTYKNHMVRHDSSCGPVVCSVCATRWPDQRALRAHSLIAHQRRYMCKMCGHASKSAHKAKEHYKWHAGVTFPCPDCGKVFHKSTSYLTHRRLRHATRACPLCRLSFLSDTGLSMHRNKAHRHEKADPLHECSGCEASFRSTEALTRHTDLTSGYCDTNMHVCTDCGDHYTSDTLLKEHAKVHEKKKAEQVCPQCSRTFLHARSLGAHVSRVHAGRPRAERVCELCGYKCMSASSLVQHQRTHTGEKPYECSVCTKRFSVTQRLQIHMRSHTGERPFQCARCPKAFKHKAALNRHDRVHTGVKPYACDQCGKRFSQSNSLKQHCAGVHMRRAAYARLKNNEFITTE